MARDTDNTLSTQRTTSGKDFPEYGLPTTVARDYDAGARPMPTRTQTEVLSDDGRPTPKNYLMQNPTVPGYIKRRERRANQLEKNAVCRFIGGIGPYCGHKYRSWIMGCSAFLSFTCLALLIIPLISCMDDPDIVAPFSWVKGEAHWKLMIPVDWTDRFFVGLGGMTNMTKQGDTYFVKFDSVECEEVLNDACTNCQSAGIIVLVFVCISIAIISLAFLVDIHRIFQFFDLNFSKVLGIVLHLVLGVIFTVLAYVIFLTQCFSSLPSEAVHEGDGRKGVGMYIVWQLSTVAHIMLAVVIIQPISGILHLLVPTPPWANNRGLKAAKARQIERTMMDPSEPFYEGTGMSTYKAPMQTNLNEKAVYGAVPLPGDDPVLARPVGPYVVADEAARGDRKGSDSSLDSEPEPQGDLVHGSGQGANFAPTVAADAAEVRSRLQSNATGVSLSSAPTPGDLTDFQDPFANEAPVKEDSVESLEGPAQAEVQAEAPAEVPAEASVETVAAPKKSKKKSRGKAELPTKKK